MNRSFYWFSRISLIVMILIVLNSLLGDVVFRLRYSFPHVTKTTSQDIVTSNDPVQINLSGKKFIEVMGEKDDYVLNLQAKYSISGLVVTRNTNFWFRDVMRSKFDDICWIDLGIAWGDLVKDKKLLYKHWKFKSYKSIGMSRRLEWKSKKPHNSPWDMKYFSSHISHTHMIPSNGNVMGALLKVKKNDVVKLDGYLVDIYNSKTSDLIAKTSMSRIDRDSTSRGSGACENMYVMRVQIGDNVYE